MKKLILSISIIILGSTAYAQSRQDTTLVYSRPGIEKDPWRSQLTRNVSSKDNVWTLTLTDNKGVIQEVITYADEKLEVRQGPYKLYHNVEVLMEGNYGKGYQIGEWKTYHLNKKLAETVNYKWGKRQGKYQSFWDNGQLKEEGVYENDHKVGQWKLFNKEAQVVKIASYNSQGEETEVEYLDRGTVKVMEPISYSGGMKAFENYLSRQLHYPKAAKEKKIEGTVQVSFTVKKDASIADIRVMASPNEELSQEAIRVIRKSTGWIPGKELGEPVDMRIKIPISFKL